MFEFALQKNAQTLTKASRVANVAPHRQMSAEISNSYLLCRRRICHYEDMKSEVKMRLHAMMIVSDTETDVLESETIVSDCELPFLGVLKQSQFRI